MSLTERQIEGIVDSLRTASFTLKGIYRCDICNAGKYGQPGNEPEANQEKGHAE